MSKSLSLKIAFFSLFLTVNCFAQTIPLQWYEPSIIMLETDKQLNINPPLGTGSINIQVPAYYSVLFKIRVVKKDVCREVFSQLYNKPIKDEKTLIREEWKKAFGMDVWYPYYKAKAIEKRIKEKLSVRIFKLKGTPEFKKGRILYIFKTRF